MAKQNYIIKNGVAQPFPIPEAARPTISEMREVLGGYDQQGVLLPNSAIITDSESKVDVLRCGTLYADTIDGVVVDIPEEEWTNTAPTNITVGGLLSNANLVGLSPTEILERILYAFIPASVNTFNLGNLPLSNDIGTNLGGSTPTFAINITNPSSSTGLNITYSGVASGTLVTGLSPTTSSYTATIPQSFVSNTPGATITVTLTAVQSNSGYSSATSSRSIRWWSRSYYGKSTNSNLTDFSGLSVGGSKRIETTGDDGMTAEIGELVGGYVYFFIHNSRNLVSILQGPLDATNVFNNLAPTTINGITYSVYRSQQILNGEVDFTVNTTT
jgi:hypothetical protein